MKNLPRDLLASWCTVLLVSTFACTKANFVRATNGAGGAGGAGGVGDTGGAGSGGDTGGVGGIGATGGVGDTGGAADASLGPEAGTICPAPSVLACVPSTIARCDPVCQTGTCDWCTQKCSYALAGATAQPTCARKGQKTFPQACGVTSSGSVGQYDDCAPGSICLPPIIGDNPTYCFSLCGSKVDCLYAVQCGQRKLSSAGGLVFVCDPPYDPCGVDGTCCDPLGGTGCAANRVCLLVSPDLGSAHSRTVCEFANGDGRNGSPCESSRDCQKKNTCANNICRQVCNSNNACPNFGTCTPWGSEYGICPS
jgi:hypothetical protein